MPRAKSKSTNNTAVSKTVETKLPVFEKENCCPSGKFLLPKRSIIIIAIAAILILGLVGFFFKDKFVVATINGKPIFRFEVTKRIFSTYGKETLENLIVENLIKAEVKKQNINISTADVDAEISKVTANLGQGTKLEDALSLQGMTLQDFRNQILLKLQVNKLLEKEITVTEDEINTFIKNSPQYLTATGEAERKTEATTLVKDQKISARIQAWISELLAKAKINRFLK